MTNEHQAEPELLDLARMTPKQIARRLGVSLAQAEMMHVEARGEWAGCIMTIGEDGISRPEDHGDWWNPGPGEARSRPWPDGTYGHQPRNKVRRWRRAATKGRPDDRT